MTNNQEIITKQLFSKKLISQNGFYGEFGGSFIPEILHESISELTQSYEAAISDPAFLSELAYLQKTYAGRPTPLTFAENLTKKLGGPQIFLKREDLNHTGSHKFNNVLGQALLAKRLGKTELIAETGAGQHGMATATIAAKLNLSARIYMGAKDVRRQFPNVFWMQKLGAKVISVEEGGGVLKDAIDQALRDWAQNFATSHYLLGTACGPHPFPEMVTRFQSIVGTEANQQIKDQANNNPKAIYACVGGGSNALSLFSGFIDNPNVNLIGVEAGGKGDKLGQHASRIASSEAAPGIAQGYSTMFLQTNDGQLANTHSVAAGLDYVGVSPILAHLAQQNKVKFISAKDNQVVEAVKILASTEGIIPALESAHAVAGFLDEYNQYNNDDIVIINISGRGDKDIFTIASAFDDDDWYSYIADRIQQRGEKE